jgi:hypothetical protein
VVSTPARHRGAESQRSRPGPGWGRRQCPDAQGNWQRAKRLGASRWLEGRCLADARACPLAAGAISGSTAANGSARLVGSSEGERRGKAARGAPTARVPALDQQGHHGGLLRLGFSALFSAITGARPEARKRHIRILSVIASREGSTWAMYDDSLWVLQG